MELPIVHPNSRDGFHRTSSGTGRLDRVDLRPSTDGTELFFEPTIVDNPNNSAASVCGRIVYSKKRKSDSAFPAHDSDCVTSKGRVPCPGRLEIDLGAGETRELFVALASMYAMYEVAGSVSNIGRIDAGSVMHRVLAMLGPDGAEVMQSISTLLDALPDSMSADGLRDLANALGEQGLSSISADVNAAQLVAARDWMAANLENPDEGAWQRFFEQYRWVLSMVLALPYEYLRSKAYLGGKGLGNAGGRECDFVYKNAVDDNLSLVEIKTPCAPLLGSSYRSSNVEDAVFTLSAELTGAVGQVLGYREHLENNLHTLARESEDSFCVHRPEAMVVIGCLDSLSTKGEVGTFERFRNSLHGVQVVTFDEVLRRVEELLRILIQEDGGCHSDSERKDV